MKNSLTFLVKELLVHNQLRIDNEELSFQIESHPSYPSLHAVTGVLDHFNVPNIALDVPVTENILRQLPATFLAQITTDKGAEFAIVKNRGLTYEVRTDLDTKVMLSLVEFLDKFTGILVAVEKGDNYNSTRKRSKNSAQVLICILVFLVVAHFMFQSLGLHEVLYFGFALLGVFISYSVYRQEQGETSFLGNAFCTNESKKRGCNAVLSSKGARLFKNYKLSDLSLSYFGGVSIATYFLTLLSNELSILFLISILTIPMTLFSLYYQKVVVKEWCLLCLSIVAVLWGQAAISITQFSISNFFSLEALKVACASFLIAFIIWELIRTARKTKGELVATTIKYVKFKRNFDLFKALLEKSKPINTSLNAKEIMLGNPVAPLELTIITNPMCGFCQEVHTLAEDIYKKFQDQVSIGIRFNVNCNDFESDAVKVSGRLLELFDENKTNCLLAMHDVYNGVNLTSWFEKWNVMHSPDNYITVLKQQNDWCAKNAINFTPEILINGRPFPKAYDRRDLIYFIEELRDDKLERESELQLAN